MTHAISRRWDSVRPKFPFPGRSGFRLPGAGCVLFSLLAGFHPVFAPILLAGPHAGYRADADFRNPIYDTAQPPSTNAALTMIGGGSAGMFTAGTWTYPVSETEPGATPQFRLQSSAFGQPVELSRPDVYLGQVISPPVPPEAPEGFQVDWTAMAEAWRMPTNPAGYRSAFFEPSTRQVVVAQGGEFTITWAFTDGVATTDIAHTYRASSAPYTRPYRIYWTEPPFNAPMVDLSGKHVKFHWNDDIHLTAETNGQGRVTYTSGLWQDEGQALRAAAGQEGFVVMQYFKTGSLQQQVPNGVIVVQVLEPNIRLLTADIGRPLHPRSDHYTDQGGLVAKVTRGLHQYVYQHSGQYSYSPKNGWVFPVRKSVGEPWKIEVYWEETDLMGTLWPYEVNWYEADWPADAQRYVRGPAGKRGAAVPLPADFTSILQDFQEPPGHARLDGRTFSTDTDDGYSLLKFLGADNVWFQAVHSVRHDNTNVYDRTPFDWTIGEEIAPAGPLADQMAFDQYHGYIFTGPHDTWTDYNVDLYSYPTELDPHAKTWIYAVNTNTLLEVWWSETVRQAEMPAPVHWPAVPQTYRNRWPTNTPQIVLASGQGSGDQLPHWAAPIIYYQNDPALHGYNPNEEHAFAYQNKVYALRDDLNTPTSSDPYVLVQYQDPAHEWQMDVFQVVRTNVAHPAFTYDLTAGLPICGPAPLNLLPHANNPATGRKSGPGWRDRNLQWWAKAAGHDGGDAAIVMTNYYAMQPGFHFPGRPTQPEPGTLLPWLPINATDYGTRGEPVNVHWNIHWPTHIPVMDIGETLLTARDGLPDIWNQLSVDILYQQSTNLTGQGRSVQLFDPTIARGVSLPQSLEAYGFTDTGAPNITHRHGFIYFHGLPPNLSERFYYNPHSSTKNLQFIGQYVQHAAGGSYLLVNSLSDSERLKIKNLCLLPSNNPHKAEWDAAIDALAVGVVDLPPNQPFDRPALSAIGQGAGYVTLAFNNATHPAVQVNPGLPVSLEIIQTTTNLCRGKVFPLTDRYNLLSSRMNMQFSESFAGSADQFHFQWWVAPPHPDGNVPRDIAYSLHEEGRGLTRITVGGEGATLQNMVNQFFKVRYQPVTNMWYGRPWSRYTEPALSEGWVQRVLNALTPFEQRLRDLYENPVETQISMISQAGPPYVGNVALNMEHIEEVGLIQLYSTIMNLAKQLSIELGENHPAANQQLLLAAGRLANLYMLLGNEAYADAMDPTIGFGSDAVINNAAVLPLDYGAYASSLFAFDNQLANLLDEELALLRGRARADQPPGMNQYPYFNRLVWNFTRGITAGEVAYAVNYNIQEAEGVGMDADTAARLYPMGHGDAWGHYLSALDGYYRLLNHHHFDWGDTAVTEINVGLNMVEVDYHDEDTFAAAAAGLARTGREITARAWRAAYAANPGRPYAGHADADPYRAWGVADWANRGGLASLYNWATAQSLLPPADPSNTFTGEGVRRIDRSTAANLSEIRAQYVATQALLDQFNGGLNPLGIAPGAIPFDISPAQIDAGKTHFEQIYDRALRALHNAAAVFDHAQDATANLRRQSESAAHFERAVLDSEFDYKQRLIEIFGFPYADDIGPGQTYSQGYDGPDLVHYMYMDLRGLGFGNLEIAPIDIHSWTWTEDANNPFSVTNSISTTIRFHTAANGLPIKPAEWTGARRAYGEIQHGWSDFLIALLDFRTALQTFENANSSLQDAYDWYSDVWRKKLEEQRDSIIKTADETKKIKSEIAGNNEVIATMKWLEESTEMWAELAGEGIPKSTIVGMAFGGDLSFPARAAIFSTATAARFSFLTGAFAKELRNLIHENRIDEHQTATSVLIARNDFIVADHDKRSRLKELVREQHVVMLQLQIAFQRLDGARQRVLSVLAEGERLLEEREGARQQAAALIARNRYNDMAFRIFRDEALQRYTAAFDLAARYVYLAAQAYDYETGLLRSENPNAPAAAARFYADIVRARTLGRFASDGSPLPGAAIGDGGLADILARMAANWEVLEGRLSFNNPQSEIASFSLRSEKFRIVPGAPGADNWRLVLEDARVENLFDVPEFRRYCLPFTAEGGLQSVEPGLVIPFNTEINFARNFFGRELAGGDSAFDSSHFATKIRALGIRFENYPNLSVNPRVYLLPVGDDVLRVPYEPWDTTRAWTVQDQTIPLPYRIGDTPFDSPDWMPIYDTTGGVLANLRRYPSMRALTGEPASAADLIGNSRLIGRSVWNTRWLLIIPAGALSHDREQAMHKFIYGSTGTGGVSDITLHFKTYSYSGN